MSHFCVGDDQTQGPSTALGMTLQTRLESLIYLGGGRRHASVTNSATAIPSDTSTKR